MVLAVTKRVNSIDELMAATAVFLMSISCLFPIRMPPGCNNCTYNNFWFYEPYNGPTIYAPNFYRDWRQEGWFIFRLGLSIYIHITGKIVLAASILGTLPHGVRQ